MLTMLNITDLGATAGVDHDHTDYIQSAIDQVAAHGGGQVMIPPGSWRSGMLSMRSHVDLHLARGAELRAIRGREERFPIICATPFGNLPGHIRALIFADGVEDIAITGAGVLHGDGNAELWGDDVLKPEASFRPALVFMRDCRNVLLRDVRLHYSQFWTCHLMRCQDVLIDAIDILSHPKRINVDGIDPDGCRNVRIRGCTIATTDDAICLKSTEGDPCEDIVVSDCVLSSRCCALKLGTEAMGDIRRVHMHHCIVRDSSMGVALYQKDGSIYEDISIVDCTISCRDHFPVFVDVTPRDVDDPRVGQVRRVLLADLRVSAAGRCYLRGYPGSPLRHISLRGMRWNVTGPFDPQGGAPHGARRVNPDPARIDDAQQPYHLLLSEAQDCIISDCLVDEDRSQGLGDRGLAYLRSCQNVHLQAGHRLQGPPPHEWVTHQDCQQVQLID